MGKMVTFIAYKLAPIKKQKIQHKCNCNYFIFLFQMYCANLWQDLECL